MTRKESEQLKFGDYLLYEAGTRYPAIFGSTCPCGCKLLCVYIDRKKANVTNITLAHAEDCAKIDPTIFMTLVEEANAKSSQ